LSGSKLSSFSSYKPLAEKGKQFNRKYLHSGLIATEILLNNRTTKIKLNQNILVWTENPGFLLGKTRDSIGFGLEFFILLRHFLLNPHNTLHMFRVYVATHVSALSFKLRYQNASCRFTNIITRTTVELFLCRS